MIPKLYPLFIGQQLNLLGHPSTSMRYLQMKNLFELAVNKIVWIFDVMGYVLMLTLSLVLWWGIHTGVEATISASPLAQQAASDQSLASAENFTPAQR